MTPATRYLPHCHLTSALKSSIFTESETINAPKFKGTEPPDTRALKTDIMRVDFSRVFRSLHPGFPLMHWDRVKQVFFASYINHEAIRPDLYELVYCLPCEGGGTI